MYSTTMSCTDINMYYMTMTCSVATWHCHVFHPSSAEICSSCKTWHCHEYL